MSHNGMWAVASDTTQPLRYVLSVSDGNRYALTAPTLIGRNPHPTPQDGACNLVLISDPLRTVSKTHLMIATDGGGLYVVDRDSTNGTVVTLPDGQQVICGAGQKVRITAGATVMCGQFAVRIELQ
ncbi:FHA domain-containing protein [Populibacterium corticicola]|uniref:FHA domain-containing protein n=1 Tax=Populibacterium corticicola TaxID=1812826 RepID=A0ABW5XFB4_9MICO